MSKRWDFNLVEEKGSFKIKEALESLPILVRKTSDYICRCCLRFLKRIDAARLKVKELENDIVVKYKTALAAVTTDNKSLKRALFVPVSISGQDGQNKVDKNVHQEVDSTHGDGWSTSVIASDVGLGLPDEDKAGATTNLAITPQQSTEASERSYLTIEKFWNFKTDFDELQCFGKLVFVPFQLFRSSDNSRHLER
eukprot:gene15597-17170_t